MKKLLATVILSVAWATLAHADNVTSPINGCPPAWASDKSINLSGGMQVFYATLRTAATAREYHLLWTCMTKNSSDGPSGNPPREVCKLLAQVGLRCGYNSRSSLTSFLTINGIVLFPASGGTNSYVEKDSVPKEGEPDNVYVATGPQNAILYRAILQNAKLFRGPDLTVEDTKSWK